MREITADCGSVQVIGIRHENGRTVARIPLGAVADIVAEYPGGSFTLGYRRRLDNQYWVCSDFVVEGDELIWTVGSHALGVAGDVIAQVSYSDGTVIAQTPRFRFSVGKSLFDGEEGQGENLSDLVEQAITAVGQVDGKIAEAEEELDAAVAEKIDGALGGLKEKFQERIDAAIEEIGEHIDLSGKADKADTVLDTTLSRGRNAVDQVGEASFAFGTDVRASGNNSQAVGYQTVANGYNSHAEGAQSCAGGTNAHAEGGNTAAGGANSHAEGTATIASGANSHAEGAGTKANGDNSHAEGQGTVAYGKAQHAMGSYNLDGDPLARSYFPSWQAGTQYEVGDVVRRGSGVWSCIEPNADTSFTTSKWADLGNSVVAFVIGKGGSKTTRRNAFAVLWDGSIVMGNTLLTEAKLQALLALLN